MTGKVSPDPAHILPNGHLFQLPHLDNVLGRVVVKVDYVDPQTLCALSSIQKEKGSLGCTQVKMF